MPIEGIPVPANHSPKQELRAQVRQRLGAIDPADWARAAVQVCRRLVERFPRPACVMVYAPMAGEIDPGEAAMAWLGTGAVVCLPRVDWTARAMTPARIDAWPGALVASKHGVREPGPDAPSVGLDQLDVIVTPGLAFSPGGQRLGRGAGFYDRFLARRERRAQAVGVALDEQVIEHVPTDGDDVRLDSVCTPTRWLGPFHGR